MTYNCKEERLYIRSLLVSQISRSNNDNLRAQIKTVLYNDVYSLFIYIFYASKRNHNFHSSSFELSLPLFFVSIFCLIYKPNIANYSMR